VAAGARISKAILVIVVIALILGEGVAIGVLGGIYPAWRVTRMTPLKALAGG
jgi:ABC-type antimicrobial peptide transport system permease subunit